jgi:predicted kinase
MPTLYIICGIPFAGKTTLAAAIRERLDCIEVDVDEVKATLYGADTSDEALSHDDWIRIYDETDQLTERLLRSSRNVVDASRNFRKAERDSARQIARRAGAAVITIFVDTPEAVSRQRLLSNRATRSRHDVTDENFEEILQGWEAPGADEDPLVLRHGQELDSWIQTHIAPSVIANCVGEDTLRMLTVRAVHGDEVAFGELREALEPMVRSYLGQKTRDPTIVPALADIVFDVARRVLPRYPETELHPRHWMLRISRWVVVHYFQFTGASALGDN